MAQEFSPIIGKTLEFANRNCAQGNYDWNTPVRYGINEEVYGHKLRELKCLLTEAINLHKFSRLVQRRLSQGRGKYPVRLLAESLFPPPLLSTGKRTHRTFENHHHHQFSQHSSQIVLNIHHTTFQLILNKLILRDGVII